MTLAGDVGNPNIPLHSLAIPLLPKVDNHHSTEVEVQAN